MSAASAQSAHPRDSFALERLEAPTAAFEAALSRGRLHHAWLLTGPQGLGKAGFAYAAARRLLGGRLSGGDAAHDPVSRMVSARSHPDLLVLERHVEGGPARKSIPVDEARRLPEFFAKAPAIAPFRVAIIDSADDLNVNAANAVLKTLEEPSGRGVLFLVSHASGRLLPTIRSRCRRLAFAPWPHDALVAFGAGRLGLPPEAVERLAQMAHGAPGRMLSLATAGVLALDDQAAAMIGGGSGPESARDAWTEALRTAEALRGGEGAQNFALLIERLCDHLHQAAMTAASPTAADAWATLWRRAAELPGRVEGLNLDRADAFWSLLADLRATARRQGAPC